MKVIQLENGLTNVYFYYLKKIYFNILFSQNFIFYKIFAKLLFSKLKK